MVKVFLMTAGGLNSDIPTILEIFYKQLAGFFSVVSVFLFLYKNHIIAKILKADRFRKKSLKLKYDIVTYQNILKYIQICILDLFLAV